MLCASRTLTNLKICILLIVLRAFLLIVVLSICNGFYVVKETAHVFKMFSLSLHYIYYSLTCLIIFFTDFLMIFTVRCYTSAVYAVIVCPSVCHTTVLYQNC